VPRLIVEEDEHQAPRKGGDHRPPSPVDWKQGRVWGELRAHLDATTMRVRCELRSLGALKKEYTHIKIS
jgi:hypothetical protein